MNQTTYICRNRIGWLCAFSSCVVCLSGCSDGRPQCVPVNGVITLDGKSQWPAEGSMYFIPISNAAGFPKRPGSAEFDQQGNFAVRTFTPSDGLFPGTYQVQINCWKRRPTMERTRGESYLPERYRNAATSGIEVTVAPDENECQFTIEVASQ